MLNPLLLWFLPLAALPVILHLLNLSRLRDVQLPTYRFLMEGYVQQRRRLQLVEWLLLLLRTAVVALAVAALARPVVEHSGALFGGRGGRDVVFVIDTGMTTGLVTDGLSALHRIRAAVAAAVERLAPDDFVTLVRAGIVRPWAIGGHAGECPSSAKRSQRRGWGGCIILTDHYHPTRPCRLLGGETGAHRFTGFFGSDHGGFLPV